MLQALSEEELTVPPYLSGPFNHWKHRDYARAMMTSERRGRTTVLCKDNADSKRCARGTTVAPMCYLGEGKGRIDIIIRVVLFWDKLI